MRYILLILLLYPLTFFATAQNFEGGALLGLTASQIDGDDYKGYNKVGLQGGAWVKRMFTYTVGGQMEIRYVQKGAFKKPSANDPTYRKTGLHYVDIPLMAQFFYNEDVVFELGIGPEVLITARAQDEYGQIDIRDPQYYRFTMSAIVGIGYRFLDVMSVNFRFNYSVLPIRPHESGQSYLLNNGKYSNVLSIALYWELGNN